MVKVKDGTDFVGNEINTGFNHPMVKVKDSDFMEIAHNKKSFNHPMVKVKGQCGNSKQNE